MLPSPEGGGGVRIREHSRTIRLPEGGGEIRTTAKNKLIPLYPERHWMTLQYRKHTKRDGDCT